MSEQTNSFPDQFVLNGADYFLLQLDRIMYRSSGKNNVCTFVVTFEEILELEELENFLSIVPAYRWISNLRLRNGFPFSLVKWVLNSKSVSPIIKRHSLTEKQEIPDYLLSTAIKPETQAPFKIDLLQRKKAGSLLIFTWHHSLMDAHGGESFVHCLGSGQTSIKLQWIDQYHSDLPLRERSQIALEMKDFIHNISKVPLLSLYSCKSSKPELNYRLLTFTEQQSQLINERALQHGASFLLSAFYLAATTCAITTIQQQRAVLEKDDDVLIPVPLDRRRKGSNEPLIGNQVSFLFYRIPKRALLDLKGCTTELIEQMKCLMRSDSPDRNLILMDFMRRVPGSVYRYLIKQPTKGLMASFFFSDTGESLLKDSVLFNHSVTSAVHYPPTSYPPGMTFVFSRFRGCLQISLGYMKHVISEQEIEQLFTHLRSSLLGEETV